jgi:hypothetical protein
MTAFQKPSKSIGGLIITIVGLIWARLGKFINHGRLPCNTLLDQLSFIKQEVLESMLRI